ncbi:MAG: hypothetical protein A2W95_19345 [Bacteroidetes bacterium GWA2_40_14]|nr:MAG: hypothetical protein A2W95_19345 [Bacteroidetes bacterium GWA2_40_14]
MPLLNFNDMNRLFIALTLAASLASNCLGQDLLYDKIFDRFDNASKNNLVILGQKYNVNGDKLLVLNLFKYMNDRFDTIVWIIDETPSYVYYLNKYLETGNDDFRNVLIKQKTPALRKTEKQFLDEMLQLYKQRGEFRIVSVTQIDQSNITINLNTISEIISDLDSIPKLLEFDLNDLKLLTDNKVFAPSYAKINERIESIKSSFENYPELYKELFKSDLVGFMSILSATQMLIQYPLLNISAELFEKRIEYSKPLIENYLADSSVSILFQTRSILASKKTGDFDATFTNWTPIIPRIDTALRDNYNIIYGNIYYKNKPNANINPCDGGFDFEKMDKLKGKVFSLEDCMNESKNYYFDFIIVNDK